MNLYKINSFFSNNHFRIIYYHLVKDKKSLYHFNSISINNFVKQIEHFTKSYKIIPLRQAVEMSEQGLSLKNYLSITTDDGFVENYTTLAPILVEKDVSATFFLIEDCIDNQNLMWRNKVLYVLRKYNGNLNKEIIPSLCSHYGLSSKFFSESIWDWIDRVWPMDLKDDLADYMWEHSGIEPLEFFLSRERPYLTTSQINELLSQGFDIGVHTKTHPDCSKINYQTLFDELVGSSKRLSKKFNRRMALASYPFTLRSKKIYENLIKEEGTIKCLLGVKNKMMNHNDMFEWERDRQEGPSLLSCWIRFTYLPYIRRYFL